MDDIVDGPGTTNVFRIAPDAAPATAEVEAAQRALVSDGVCLLPPATVTSWLHGAVGENEKDWADFSSHWEELSPDRYAAESGTCRLRRYGQFSLSTATGELSLLPHIPFVQPEHTNPLYEHVDRHFDPLSGAFAADPVLHRLLGLLGAFADALGEKDRWNVKVHPFRVVATSGGEGRPTPEGRHRDGVTLVSSLLVGRRNATGGESTVLTPDGQELVATTLEEPGSLLLGDDRRTLHAVSPIRPLDPAKPAYRDVLVVTCTEG
ncbi:2OG-Fe dioxygenase family protein [Streptomyces sp. NPDC051219]|uniref:2OG-Fe dioxygenase family protein n=1 Tax=Streptomyces sp. NPDC051219 TaxID=3155283 RepID=UPI00344625E7